MSRVDLCALDDLEAGVVRVFHLDDMDVVVARSGSNVFAVEDRCSHDDGELGAGRLLESEEGADPEVECPRHGARFNMSTGAATRMPAVAPIEALSAEIEDGRIWLTVPEY